MTAFTAYVSDNTIAEAIKAFFEANNIKYVQEDTTFSFPKDKEKAIRAKVKVAVEEGLWATLNDDERQDFVMGAIIQQADTTKIIDSTTMKNKLKQRLNYIPSHRTI
jgi:hypothetical protein